MITLYACGMPNVLKVMPMMAEARLDYNLETINVHQGQQFSSGFLALNPNYKEPVIVDRDGPGGSPITVFESGGIPFYLAEKTGHFRCPIRITSF